MTTSDSFFAIGKTHTVCEDFARHGTTPDDSFCPNSSWGIISDGCSGSPDTDFGARFLTMTAAECIAQYGYLKDEWIIWRAKERVNLPISKYCFDATLLTVHEDNTGCIVASISGDGTVIVKYRDGTVRHCNIEYQHGAPGYLSYLLDNKRRKVFTDAGGEATFKSFKNGVAILDAECTYTPLVEDEPTIMTMHYSKKLVECVMVCSDGISSFTDSSFKAVPTEDIVKYVSNIKSYKGEFIQRRLKFFLNKECSKLGWNHLDDLSVAALYIPVSEVKS